MTLSIGLVGLGEVGQILAVDLAAAKVSSISAYDILFADPASKPSKADVPAIKCGSIGEAVKDRDLVISAVTAASDADVAASAAPQMKKGSFFLDVNSVSPGQKIKAAEIVNGNGGRYVEAAVMTPILPRRIASPMLLGGPHAEDFLTKTSSLGFSMKVFSHEYGKASATKMCRSVMIKGVEALLTESMTAARFYGVEKPVLASLSDLLPVGDWHALATYMIGRSLVHGKRRAEEMREVAQTVSEAGITPWMSDAIVERQEWAGQRGNVLDDDLGRMLDAILKKAQA